MGKRDLDEETQMQKERSPVVPMQTPIDKQKTRSVRARLGGRSVRPRRARRRGPRRQRRAALPPLAVQSALVATESLQRRRAQERGQSAAGSRPRQTRANTMRLIVVCSWPTCERHGPMTGTLHDPRLARAEAGQVRWPSPLLRLKVRARDSYDSVHIRNIRL